MPKVLRIINRLNLGGPTYNVAYLSKYLEPDFETLILSGIRDSSEAGSEHILESLNLKARYLNTMHRDISLLNDWKAFLEIRKVIREFKPDIVHTHAAKAGTVGRLAAISMNVPVIVHTFHGHVFHSYFSPFKTRIFILIERFLASRSSAIIAVSESQKRELCEEFQIAPPEKINVIPLGFDLSRFKMLQPEKRRIFRDTWKITEDEIAIGIVGRLVPVKNHQLFIDSIKILHEKGFKVKGLIIGDGELREEILDYIEKNTPKGLIIFTSWIIHIEDAYAGLDIVAMSSRNEGTPVSLIEAQAAGKIVVSTNVGGVRDIILENKTGLLAGSEPAMFAEKLIQAIEMSKQQDRNIEGDIFHERFSYRRLVRETRTLYESLLKKLPY